MLRRTVLAAAVATAGFALPASDADAATKTLRFGYILAPESQLGAGGAAFAEEAAKRTEGRYKIEQFPNAALGGEVEMIKALQLGTIDLAFITGAPLPTVLPEVGVFNIPFLFRDAQHAHAALDGPVGQAYLQKFAEKDLVALAWGENGMRHITNSKRPVRAPEDLKGLKLRLPQSEVMLLGFKALGAEASPLPFPQLFSALQSGQFDGQENPIATIVAAKFASVQKHITLSGHVYDPAVILMSPDAHEELSGADREAFVEAARLGGKASRKFAAEAQAKGADELAKAGMEVVRDIDRAKFVDALAAIKPELEKRYGAELIEKIRSAK